MDAKGMMAPILLALMLACLVLPAKCEGGGGSETSAGGGLRRQPDGEEAVIGGGSGSGKIYIVLCLKSTCTPGSKTCYCCHALPSKPCFWDQHECWSYCPSRRQRHQLPLPAAPAAAPSSVIREPQYRSVT